MRVLLSTIGSRGDVEPILALAIQLKALDQQVRVCAPPDFQEWIEAFAIPAIPIGPMLRPLTATSAPILSSRPSFEVMQKLVSASVATQFDTITEAARGCDVLLAGGALQVAARSVTQLLGSRYVYASYCPGTLPSAHHAPPPIRPGDRERAQTMDNETLWAQDAKRFNETFGAALNSHRTAAGLPPVADVRTYIYGDQPWLAADATLAPWPVPADPDVIQTGAWIRRDDRTLPTELENFLDAGEPPVYLGLGSMRAPAGLSQAMIEAARAAGRRAILSRGWADLALIDDGPDIIAIGEVNQQLLFRRVAAVVHHGGAGTTTAAARAGAPQAIIPQNYDQYYWARRVQELGIGAAHPEAMPTIETISACLRQALKPDVSRQAKSIARSIRSDGANVAARRLVQGAS